MAAKKKKSGDDWNKRLNESAKRAKTALENMRKPTEREKDEREMRLERRASEERDRYEHPEYYYDAEDYAVPFGRRPDEDDRRAWEAEREYADYRSRGRGFEPSPPEYGAEDDWEDAKTPKERFALVAEQTGANREPQDTEAQARGQAEDEYRERMRRKLGY